MPGSIGDKRRGGVRQGAGRKHTLSNPEIAQALEDLCKLQCTQVEIAAFMKVTVQCVEQWAAVPKYREIMNRGRNAGLISLRRAQYNAALGGNVTMQIWLGKQLLGQRDEVVSRHEGAVTIRDDTQRQLLIGRLSNMLSKQQVATGSDTPRPN